MASIKTFRIRIERLLVQGGLTNDEFGTEEYYDYRFVHRFATKNFMKIQGSMNDPKKDSKFHDLVCKETGNKSEGKRLKPKSGVCFAPSVDVGAGRKVDKTNIQKCFDTNSSYYLYTTTCLDDTFWELTVRWVPIEMIKKWYSKYANNSGSISYNNCMKCIDDSPQEDIITYISSLESGFSKV